MLQIEKIKAKCVILLAFIILPGILFAMDVASNGVVKTISKSISDPKEGIYIASNGVARIRIVTADDISLPEQTAAMELSEYLKKATGGTFVICPEQDWSGDSPAIYLGNTRFAGKCGLDLAEFASEEWTIRTVENNLILAGGAPRGTLYAVYHFLEDSVGVHWWTPFEETVPDRPSLVVKETNRRAKPAFRYRDIYQFYVKDEGLFAARSRVNRRGDEKMAVKFGGSMTYGLPYHCHTMSLYFNSKMKSYFKKHPEWFPLIDGVRQYPEDSNGNPKVQLCLTNKALQDYFVKKLRNYIKQSRKRAIENGESIPVFYSIDMNDISGGWCQCDACREIAEREGSPAGLVLSFVNTIADRIKKDYPDIYISTLAYYETETPPKTIRPRDNVVIRLCNTGGSLVRSFANDKNSKFRNNVIGWSKTAKNLSVWDYGITYSKPVTGLPTPSLRIYGKNYRFLAEQGVMGIFTEFEHPVTADLRDMKLWVICKLMENPHQSTRDLIQIFTDGYYGSAGQIIRTYLGLLETGFDANPSYINSHPSIANYRYLDLKLLRKAQALFDQAEALTMKDSILLRRVRHARLSLDRASLLLYPKLAWEWITNGDAVEKFPLDRKQIAKRIRATFNEQWAFRKLDQYKNPNIDDNIENFIKQAMALQYREYPIPRKFKDIAKHHRIFDFPVDKMRLHKISASNIPDASTGRAVRIMVGENEKEIYSLPMSAGLYDQTSNQIRDLGRNGLTKEEISGPGFHWYKIGENCTLTLSTYLYFFKNWIVQVDLGSVLEPQRPNEQFDIWASMKFEGPDYPYPKPGDKNAVYVERVILVRK